MSMGGTFADSVVDDEVAISHGVDGGHLVRHQHGGAVGCERCNEAINVSLKVLVDITQRLIEHEQLRLGNDGASEEGSLELPAGEPSDGTGGEVAHLDLLKHLSHTGSALLSAYILDAQESGGYHVLDRDGEVAVDAIFLGQVSHGGTSRREGDRASRGTEQSKDQSQQGGLATTVRTCNSHKITTIDRQIDIGEDLATLAVKAHTLKRHQRLVGDIQRHGHRVGVVTASAQVALNVVQVHGLRLSFGRANHSPRG